MTIASPVPLHYDPFETHDDPYPTFARLRAEQPLYRNEARDLWILTRFGDVQAAARDWKAFSSHRGVVLDDESDFYAPGGFVDQDPPSHDRLRKAVAQYFSPRATANLATYVRRRTRELLEPVRETGSLEVIGAIARPLPTDVVSKLLGVPAEDHSIMAGWFAGMLERVPGQVEAPPSAWSANRAMRQYMTELVNERAARPRDDLASILAAAARTGELSHDEAVALCVFMFYAGIITTAGLIGNSVINLLRFPAQLALIRSGARPMIEAVEELLRYDAPIQSLRRVLMEPVTLYDQEIPAGADVLLVWASANRDERRWSDPDVIDLSRAPRRHLAFWRGDTSLFGRPSRAAGGRDRVRGAVRVDRRL